MPWPISLCEPEKSVMHKRCCGNRAWMLANLLIYLARSRVGAMQLIAAPQESSTDYAASLERRNPIKPNATTLMP
jgi:hypothetical protein